jgi:hypothetical protein
MMAASITWSAVPALTGYSISPSWSKLKETDPVVPSAPPFLEKAERISVADRFLLSVEASTMMPTPPGPTPS